MNKDDQRKIMKLIIESGESKKMILSALNTARVGDINEAKQLLDDAQKVLLKTHSIHTELLGSSAYIDDIDILGIHAEDHLMTSMLFLDVAKEFIHIYDKLADKS